MGQIKGAIIKKILTNCKLDGILFVIQEKG
jgi:hypothetical protein